MDDKVNRYYRGQDYVHPSDVADGRPFLTPRFHCDPPEEEPEGEPNESQVERMNRLLRSPNTGTRGR
jgi:hypothetical protein